MGAREDENVAQYEKQGQEEQQIHDSFCHATLGGHSHLPSLFLILAAAKLVSMSVIVLLRTPYKRNLMMCDD